MPGKACGLYVGMWAPPISLPGFFFSSALKDGTSQSGVTDPHAVLSCITLVVCTNYKTVCRYTV